MNLIVTHLLKDLFSLLEIVLFLRTEGLTKLGIELRHLAVLFALLDGREQHNLGLTVASQTVDSAQ